MRDWSAYVRERLRLGDLRPERAEEIVEEIAGELEEAYREALAGGLGEAEAEAAAAAHVTDWEALGSAARESPSGRIPALDLLAERAAERRAAQRGLIGFLAGIWRDALYGLRLLGRNRGFAAAAVLTMAIGIGANTAVFSIINSTLFFRLPYPNPGRIVSATIPQDEFSFRAWERENRTFTAISAGIEDGMTLTGAGTAERVGVVKVTSGFFPVVGIRPMLGRAFFASDTRPGGPDIAILTYGLWRDRFGADPKVIGREIHLNDRLYTIVGVMPKTFEFPYSSWSSSNPPNVALLPLRSFSTLKLGSKGQVLSVSVEGASALGRLKPGVSLLEAQANLRTIQSGVRYGFGRFIRVKLTSLHDLIVGNNRQKLLIFWGAVGFLLLIACVNVANLALARALSREKETAVRVALGAHRRRVARQLLTENVLVAMLGGVAGIAVAYAIVILVRSLGPGDIARLRQTTIDLRVLGFTFGVAALAGILAGLAPVRAAWRLSTTEALKEGGRTSAGRGHQRLRSALVVVEIALALILAIGAGLLVRSFVRLTSVPLGFNPHHLLTAQLALPPAKYTSPEQQVEFEQALLERAKQLPSVTSAAVFAGDVYPGTLQPNTAGVLQIEGHPARPGVRYGGRLPFMGAFFGAVSPDFFETTGVRIVKGRDFRLTDTASSPKVAIVDETFVRWFLPHIDPIGQRFAKGMVSGPRTDWTTIVGVAADIESGRRMPVVYLPYAQNREASLLLLVRTRGNPLAIVPALREQVEGLDSDLPVFGVATMDHLLGEQVATPRFDAALLGAFALVGLLLAALGVYGVISYSVAERTHEIGIRLALGAEKSAVMRMIFGRTLLLALVGIAIGIGGALALTRYLRSLLYQIRPDDPWTFALAAAVLLGAAFLAGFLPARRATEIDPLSALRHE